MKNLTEILNSLIIQSKTDNLKWSAYPDFIVESLIMKTLAKIK